MFKLYYWVFGITFIFIYKYAHTQSTLEDTEILIPASNQSSIIAPLIQMIVEYVQCRELDHIILFDSNLKRGEISYNLLQLIDCLSLHDIYSTVYSTFVPMDINLFHVNRHRLGVIVLFDQNQSINQDHIIIKASKHKLFDEQHSWLLITTDTFDYFFENIVKAISLSLMSDMVIARTTSHISYDSQTKEFKCLLQLPLNRIHSDSNETGIKMTECNQNDGRINNAEVLQSLYSYNMRFELVQIYKIRKEDEKSLIRVQLGEWNMCTHFTKIKQFLPIEGRLNFFGYPLYVGFKNWSIGISAASYHNSKSNVFDTNVDDTENLQEIMEFIARSLNATLKYYPYSAIGTEIQEGVWSDLLRAVVLDEVDIGLEKVAITYHKLKYMAFTNNIIKISHNIYMHPSEFSVSKDIYLTPFSPRLLLCVLGMAILLSLIMLMGSAAANYNSKNNLETQFTSASHAVLWIVGILSMQGSIWSPVTSSGNMILISSLMFALIIYNSYAAFITSILSVKSSDIKSLNDLFENGYSVGYIQNSLDEIYLQSQVDELKSIYLRGYDSRVADIEIGLQLAAKTKYALFVSTQAARRSIQTLSPYECRCQIQEFPLKTTVEDVAFPLSKTSPYKKIINLGVMRLKESGTLSKIQRIMLPDMPMCYSESLFISAQLEDVLTAVILLAAGIVLSILIVIVECMIKYRKEMIENMRQNFWNLHLKIRESLENLE